MSFQWSGIKIFLRLSQIVTRKTMEKLSGNFVSVADHKYKFNNNVTRFSWLGFLLLKLLAMFVLLVFWRCQQDIFTHHRWKIHFNDLQFVLYVQCDKKHRSLWSHYMRRCSLRFFLFLNFQVRKNKNKNKNTRHPCQLESNCSAECLFVYNYDAVICLHIQNTSSNLKSKCLIHFIWLSCCLSSQ